MTKQSNLEPSTSCPKVKPSLPLAKIQKHFEETFRMCGFIKRVTDSPVVRQLLADIGMPDYQGRPGQWWPGTVIRDVVIGTSEGLRTIDPIWWFLLTPKDGQLKPDRKITCFNARNLDGKLWKQPLKTHRCLIPATSIVKTKDKNSYHMEAEEGLLIGGLHRIWEHQGHLLHSCTVITCPRMIDSATTTS